ncbi:MAG: methylisocitrate lyase [Alphaproteobacteria bacterium]|nr:methylisocitrate lyase [Alphaproteobacteria bacterium]
MTWLENSGQTASGGAMLRARLARPGIVEVPGAHDALSALLAERAGFEALYVSGAAFSASLGLPDVGLFTLDELAGHVATIHRICGLPLIVDADTGFGEVLNVMRTVRALEAEGAAAIQIEDQVMPKKCGHLADKRLVAPAEMAAKVSAAARARRDMLVVARTDAAAEGLEGAIARARLYAEAGADIVFADALASEADFRAFVAGSGAPVLANMTEFGRTPAFTARQFNEFGCRIVIWPVTSLRIAAAAVDALYRHIREHGGPAALRGQMLSRAALYEVIGYDAYAALDAAIATGALSDADAR